LRKCCIVIINTINRSMSQAVSRWPLTSEASPCGICGGESDTGTVYTPSSSVSPVSIIPPPLFTHTSSGDE
jgi:hypothetical protein